MGVTSKEGRLVIESQSHGDSEQLVNRMRAIVHTLQETCLDEEHIDEYYLLEQLDDMIPAPDQIVINI